ncbi:hypothetical protein RYX36_035753 [Vicia faba]
MEKQNLKKMEPKKVKILNTSSLSVKEQEDAFQLVGSIVEKGIDDGDSQSKTTPFYSFPKPSVVPFPVARHRSHGPHWHPLNSKGGYDHGNDESDNDIGDEEDADLMGFEKVAAFANPIQRKKTKGMDFEKWKEITQDDKSSSGRDLANDVTAYRKKKNANDGRRDEDIENNVGEKLWRNKTSKKKEPKKVKILNTSSLSVKEQEDAFQLVGSIVEKGIDDGDSQSKTTPFYSFPKPSVVPFPIARHRSHGPHWHPLNSKGGYDHGNDESDNDIGDEEDADLMGFEKVAAFANPIQRKKIKGMDFGKWK